MHYVLIEWSAAVNLCRRIHASAGDYLDRCGFYMVLTGKFIERVNKYVDISLQYIGKAFDQVIRERVQQEHTAYKGINDFVDRHSGYEALVRPGVIISSSPRKKKTETAELYDDVEACLIFANQPEQNTAHRKQYTGRNITITNMGGYYPLEKISVGEIPVK
jgi:hypothetical protein